MTEAEIDNLVALMRAAGRTTIPMDLDEWRALMATKVKGSIKDGKFRPADTTPKPLRGAKQRKAARTVKGLKANREGKR